ncbi:hypothetical protein [Arthrobacter zhaoguopingii]|uniref:hypothetical protein n=1 Tax=Arthrobacter zhaoguopingii TaxID=2681491 RepID=UPI001359566D|nr:hypothetical protein [Arthrobacter zhaoguopingii]
MADLTDATDLLRELGLSREAILQHEALPFRGPPTAYLSGSLVEGLGNYGSDIDVFVIDGSWPRSVLTISRQRCRIGIRFHEHRRIDYEYWDPERVHQLANRLNNLHVGERFVADSFLPEEEHFIHRLITGLALNDAAGLQEWQSRFDSDLFRRFLTQQAVHRIDGALEDVWGMVDSADWDSALLRARDLVGLGADLWNHSHGSTNSAVKWRARLLALTDPSGTVHRRFWALQNCEHPEREEGAVRAYVHKCAAFAEELVEEVQS